MPPSLDRLTRRQFLGGLGALFVSPVLEKWFQRLGQVAGGSANLVDVYVARNEDPVGNVNRVISLAGGIQRFIGYDDIVVLKPNGQWPNQGYTHTQCIKALIDLILNRPGGFAGEVILTEHVHRDPTEAMKDFYCWNMSADNRTNNWADMNYLELINDYQSHGHPIVTANPMYDSGLGNWDAVTSGLGGIGAGRQGWVQITYTTAANGRTVNLSTAILRSSYSGKLVDLKNGVWKNGDYTGQKVKLIFLPTLNNHGTFNHQDYAGPTSALKTHIGVVDFGGSAENSIHDVGYNDPISPQAMGETVGHLITQVIRPTFYLTCAEYTGYRDRTDPDAAHTRTVGLCADPVTLDYWMCKYVMYPCATSQTFMNPDNNNHLRQALLGCQSKGVGTVNEANMVLHLYDALDKHTYLPVVRR
ncbi:MAG TPA: hypothetical protein VMT46_09445 [Anaerolineaceae bacterium]|nr:hypothetical protein [Anaerolineaceae bacterium]